ncbi:amino acid ABC transporter substrate-binding protein (PAAT family) [Humitalea rosea]|uniref:Amino acid ABC transporter substrate-binding protein (PAAT family) n=1 Tax=Humitalea rosea TaxID=990373 RepID=A0A2W7IGN5_9PROT|nr:ABC transporter substrate-binding protein [Humitalea rosea]PZW45921.1 amino acid ABC transporter substrate-binding protein (PAAT family) [Humitalea rosea]
MPLLISRRSLLAAPALIAVTPALAAQRVPDSELVKPGTLTMSTNPTLPPVQYVDSTGQLKGMRIEMGVELAKRLGLTPEYVRVEFSTMITGLAARRWDLINTGMFYTEERARIMQLVRYEQQTIGICVPRGNPKNITKIEDLAGLSVGVEQGGFEYRRSQDLIADLQKANLAPITVRAFDNFAVSFQALRVGQLDAAIAIDSTCKNYDDRGEFTHAIKGLYGTPVTVGMRSRVLATAVAAAFTEMRADGFLPTLMGGYGISGWPEPYTVVGPT